MSSLGSTSIDSLPTINNNSNNIAQITSNEENIKIENYGQQLNDERKKDMNNIQYSPDISLLKEASENGGTALPSRDIPNNTISIQNDNNIIQNQIPVNNNDYIGNIITNEEMIKNSYYEKNKNDNINYIFETIQIPLLISLLYFIFQMPIIRINLFKYLPMFFNKDGNQNLYGYLFNSILFGVIFLLIQKVLEYTNTN
tara:strand:+ start:1617 stop:2213 length:597 start_codon:yes stop_codon:yes gene_type:complete